MDISASIMPNSPLMVYSGTIEIIATIAFFIIASSFESFDKKILPIQTYPKLRLFQLIATGLILLLSATHAALLAYPSAFLTSEADPAVACALFVLFTWIVLLLPLIDRESDAAYPHFGAWTVALAFESLCTGILLHSVDDNISANDLADRAVVVVRLAVQAILLGTSLITKATTAKSEEGTPEETQPLLDVESRAQKSNDKNQEDKDDEEDETNEEEEEAEFWKEGLEELKKRPWTSYLASFKIFLPHLRPRTNPEYLYLVVMLVCTGIARVLNVLTPLSLGWTVNSLDGATTFPWKALGLYLGLYFTNSSAGISIIENLASIKLSMSMRLSLDVFVYNHIMNLDAKFHDDKKTASLGRVTDRGDTVIDLFQEFFFDFMPTVADLVISLAVLQWLFGAYVCFIVATTGVLFAWSNMHLIKNRTSLRRKYMNAWYAVYQHMWETQYNWTTVSHFGRVEHEKENFREMNSKKMSKELALTTYTEMTRCTRQLIMTAGFICAVSLAVNQIIQGHRKVGDFVMLVTYWSQVMAPVRSIINTITSVSERLVDAEKLMIVLEKQPTVKNSPNAKALDFQGGSVDFENVTFSYDGERTVSEGITFHAEAGQTIALVGETGGGKSTLLKLLFRFYDPTSGRILIDGQDLSEVTIESFRDLVGIVPQDPAMFNRSIFDNVRYPNGDATEEDVIEACKAACLHDKIMTFAKQYKEKVGENGTKLSGGECQRLAIARAILKKPKMLLLDEATSAVDSVTENKIQACLKQLCQGRTTFVIAHRLSTILQADQIMVIKGGKLLEMGPHKQLIKKKGFYRELWDAQLNLQAQDPGNIDDKGKTEEDGGSRKEKKESMFFNDMGKEKIDKVMLGFLHDDDDESRSSPESSGGKSKDVISTPEDTAVEGDVGSEDVTEVESFTCAQSESNDKDKSSTK